MNSCLKNIHSTSLFKHSSYWCFVHKHCVTLPQNGEISITQLEKRVKRNICVTCLVRSIHRVTEIHKRQQRCDLYMSTCLCSDTLKTWKVYSIIFQLHIEFTLTFDIQTQRKRWEGTGKSHQISTDRL